MGLLANSDGSAEWQTPRNSRLLCSVNGPLEVRIRDELPQHATLELVVRPSTGLPTLREVLMADRMHPVLNSILLRDLMPRSLVEIVVQVLESRASSFIDELAGSINVVCLALVSAGIPLAGMLAAVCFVVQNGEILETPLADPMAAPPTSEHVVAFRFSGNSTETALQPQLVLCESSGKFDESTLLAILERAQEAVGPVYDRIRSIALEETTQSLEYAR